MAASYHRVSFGFYGYVIKPSWDLFLCNGRGSIVGVGTPGFCFEAVSMGVQVSLCSKHPRSWYPIVFRAATMKSSIELAAARDAEISMKLKAEGMIGNEDESIKHPRSLRICLIGLDRRLRLPEAITIKWGIHTLRT